MPFSAKERDTEYCRSIIEAYQHIQQYVDGMKKPEFMMDTKTQDAVAMRLQQALECANKFLPETKAGVKINWSALTALQDRQIHTV